MRRQARRDTRPEMAVRKAAHALGLRYRVDAQLPLPGLRRRADLLFRTAHVAVFVDGCFWHACPTHGTAPKRNTDWWARKLRANVDRDRETDRLMEATGWLVVRIWEHEDPVAAASRLRVIVDSRRTGVARRHRSSAVPPLT